MRYLGRRLHRPSPNSARPKHRVREPAEPALQPAKLPSHSLSIDVPHGVKQTKIKCDRNNYRPHLRQCPVQYSSIIVDLSLDISMNLKVLSRILLFAAMLFFLFFLFFLFKMTRKEIHRNPIPQNGSEPWNAAPHADHDVGVVDAGDECQEAFELNCAPDPEMICL